MDGSDRVGVQLHWFRLLLLIHATDVKEDDDVKARTRTLH